MLIQVQENKYSVFGLLFEILNVLDIENLVVVGEIDIVCLCVVVIQVIDVIVVQVDVLVWNMILFVGGLFGLILLKDCNGFVELWFNMLFWVWGGERIEFIKFDVLDVQFGKKLEFDYFDGNCFLLKDSND